MKILEVEEQTNGTYKISGITQKNYVEFIVPRKLGEKFIPQKEEKIEECLEYRIH